MRRKPTVLFLCTHNAGRSLAAKVLLDHYAAGQVDVRSAGSDPASDLNPSVVALLEERGLDPSREFPKVLTEADASSPTDHHDGVRRRMPCLPGQTLRGLGPRRPGGTRGRGSASDH